MPYQGSKRKIAKKILDFFPTGTNRLVEPFAGSAAVSIHALANKGVKSAWINDSNAPLIGLWKEIAKNPEALSRDYSRLWHGQLGNEHGFYDRIRARFNKDHDPADLLYLLARCVKAAVRYNNNGDFNNSCDNRRAGTRPDGMARRIMAAHEILRGKCRFTSLDYNKVLKGCSGNDLLYMDPPYQGTSTGPNRRYAGVFSHEEFCKRLYTLNGRKIKYILSYDGRTGKKTHGRPLPKHLQLERITINAGRSTQATLLGKKAHTQESLYLSPNLSACLSRNRHYTGPPN